MITSLDFTDSLDGNIMDFSMVSSDQIDKFSMLNTTTLTTPPPESVSSPDLSFNTFEMNEKLTNPTTFATVTKTTKRKPNSKKLKKNFFFLNQKFIKNHMNLRERLESSYKRFKALDEKINKNKSLKNRCNCNQSPTDTCIFCKLINLSPIQSQISTENTNTITNPDTLLQTTPNSSFNDLTPDEIEHDPNKSISELPKNNTDDPKKEKLKELFSTNDDIDLNNLVNFINEYAKQEKSHSNQDLISPYFYSDGRMWEGIHLNQEEFVNLEFDYEFGNKRKKMTRKQEAVKTSSHSLTRANRQSHFSETTDVGRLRTRSARSASSSSTRSSNQSEVCTTTVNNDKFDINNIFIPTEIISCQKITPFQTHKIPTPKWREFIIEPLKDTTCEEALDDVTVSNRHEIIELKEKIYLTNNKKAMSRIDHVDSVDELKSMLLKIDPKLVNYDYDENSNSSLTSTLEWPERKFPLSDSEYENILKEDNTAFN
ncbi:unnamed protein product [Brachionus calyciflorus]|uniref:PEHE domain-containing protein n=1 Tax=Brachionus calyciflorus TaxID=104777 RepID=A0A813ME08_9BILA|nr:unnamed protein product [Brachionus calyciflorus]